MKAFLSILLLSALTLPALSQTQPGAILGEWLSSQKDSRILIYKQGDKFYGRISWGTGPLNKDAKNPDASLRERPLIGLVILTDFVFDGKDTWEDGKIYDPREGKTYSCKMKLSGNNKLNIRGFVGLSLFGRTDVWTKYVQQ